MSLDLRAKVLAYLRDHNVLSLATYGPAGVWAAAVFYVNDGLTLYFLSAAHTRHSQNIAGNEAVAVTIQEDYRQWEAIKGIQLEGRCTLLAGAERDAAIALYASKFPIIGPAGPPAIATALSKVGWYKVTPSKVYFIDNSLGLGHRDEVPLSM
jgi:hypothetical protein